MSIQNTKNRVTLASCRSNFELLRKIIQGLRPESTVIQKLLSIRDTSKRFKVVEKLVSIYVIPSVEGDARGDIQYGVDKDIINIYSRSIEDPSVLCRTVIHELLHSIFPYADETFVKYIAWEVWYS